MRATVLASLLAVTGLQLSSVSAADRLAMQVRPPIGIAPADVLITIRLEVHPDNRFVVVEAESEAAYRSSMEQLDGDRSPRTRLFRWRGLPPGEYAIRTTLVRAGGERVVARAQMQVLSGVAD